MLLQLSDVRFAFRDESPLLEGFELGVANGEFVALLGPSGCGKSTVLNLAAGLLTPCSGSVTFEGEPLAGINRKVGYMTQGDTLLPWLSVEKNVLLPLELRGMPAAQRRERVQNALRLVNLVDARARLPSELSGGMKRRALLARSLVYDPPLLLMDEPFAALDAQLREGMHKELLATVNRIGESVLFVTHDISESILLADRVLMTGGRPLRIVDEVRVPFGKDRDLDAVRVSREYATLEARLRAVLRRGALPGEDVPPALHENASMQGIGA